MKIQPNVELFSALANTKRLQIVMWLRDPVANFPIQKDGDLIKDGVCAGAIVKKLGVSQPTITAHMKILLNAKVVSAKSIKQYTFYRLNIDTLREIKKIFSEFIEA